MWGQCLAAQILDNGHWFVPFYKDSKEHQCIRWRYKVIEDQLVQSLLLEPYAQAHNHHWGSSTRLWLCTTWSKSSKYVNQWRRYHGFRWVKWPMWNFVKKENLHVYITKKIDEFSLLTMIKYMFYLFDPYNRFFSLRHWRQLPSRSSISWMTFHFNLL